MFFRTFSRSLPAAALFFVTFTVPFVNAAPIPAGELLAYFSNSCGSQDNWTNEALNQAQSLIYALQTVQNDPDCATIAGVVGQLNSITDRVAQITALNADSSQIQTLQAREQEQLLQLSSTSDSSERAILKQSLWSTQVALAGVRASSKANAEASTSKSAFLLGEVVTGTRVVLNQALANQKCLFQPKGLAILSGIGAFAGSIAAAAAVTNPALSLGLMGGTNLIGITVDFIRREKIQNSTRRINQAIATEAYQCVLESLSNFWCRSSDAMNVIKIREEARSADVKKGSLIAAARLIDREVPALFQWLNSVRSSADPNNSADASRQQRVFTREAQVRSALSQGVGFVNESIPLFALARDNEAKWQIVRSTIQSIISSLISSAQSSQGTSPALFEIYQYNYSPYFLLGLTEAQAPKPFGSYLDISAFNPFDPTQWKGSTPYAPSLDDVLTKFKEWVELARIRVLNEQSIVLQPDVLRTINEAVDPVNIYRISALESINTVIDFLSNSKPKFFEYSSFDQLYSDTIIKLVKVKAAVEGVLANKKEPKDAITEIYQLLNLQYGNIILKGRLELSVKLALMSLFKNAAPEEQNTAAQLLASDRILDALQLISGTDDLTRIRRDIDKARTVNLATTQAFVDQFGKQLRRSLEFYQQSEEAYKTSNGAMTEASLAFSRSRAELCLKLLSAPRWPRDVPYSYCEGVKLDTPGQPKWPVSITVSEETIALPYEQRVCSYRDFLRRSKIYREYATNPPKWATSFNSAIE